MNKQKRRLQVQPALCITGRREVRCLVVVFLVEYALHSATHGFARFGRSMTDVLAYFFGTLTNVFARFLRAMGYVLGGISYRIGSLLSADFGFIH